MFQEEFAEVQYVTILQHSKYRPQYSILQLNVIK